MSTERVIYPIEFRRSRGARTGTIQARSLTEAPYVNYFFFLPAHYRAETPLLISVHGITRNAWEHVNVFAALAEHAGIAVAAPLFPERDYPDYQRVGAERRGAPADQALAAVVRDLRTHAGLACQKIHLFGYSGGGQFVHRYALQHPDEIAAYAIGAAGWYTFPDATADYPLGLRLAQGGVPETLARYLLIPALVLVGEHDHGRDTKLNKSRRVDRLQGENRFERGQRWIHAMHAAAHERGLDTPFVFKSLPGADHSFARCIRRGHLAQHVFEFLFIDPPL